MQQTSDQHQWKSERVREYAKLGAESFRVANIVSNFCVIVDYKSLVIGSNT